MVIDVLSEHRFRIPPVGNGLLAIALAGGAVFLWRARKASLWRRAGRPVRRHRLGMVSLAFLSPGGS